MDKISLICNLAIAVCGIIPTIVAVVALIKKIIEDKNWKLVEKIVLEAMTTIERYAEEHTEMTSEDKLNTALEVIGASLTAAGINFDDELVKKIIAYISEMCTWSKTVNGPDSKDEVYSEIVPEIEE